MASRSVRLGAMRGTPDTLALTQLQVHHTPRHGLQPEPVPWRVHHLLNLQAGGSTNEEGRDALTQGPLHGAAAARRQVVLGSTRHMCGWQLPSPGATADGFFCTACSIQTLPLTKKPGRHARPAAVFLQLPMRRQTALTQAHLRQPCWAVHLIRAWRCRYMAEAVAACRQSAHRVPGVAPAPAGAGAAGRAHYRCKDTFLAAADTHAAHSCRARPGSISGSAASASPAALGTRSARLSGVPRAPCHHRAGSPPASGPGQGPLSTPNSCLHARPTVACANIERAKSSNSSSCVCAAGSHISISPGTSRKRLTLQNMLCPWNPVAPSTCPITCSSAIKSGLCLLRCCFWL